MEFKKIQEFQPDDFVRLKSGGPIMSVATVHSENTFNVRCLWFTITGEYHDKRFPARNLDKVERIDVRKRKIV